MNASPPPVDVPRPRNRDIVRILRKDEPDELPIQSVVTEPFAPFQHRAALKREVTLLRKRSVPGEEDARGDDDGPSVPRSTCVYQLLYRSSIECLAVTLRPYSVTLNVEDPAKASTRREKREKRERADATIHHAIPFSGSSNARTREHFPRSISRTRRTKTGRYSMRRRNGRPIHSPSALYW